MEHNNLSEVQEKELFSVCSLRCGGVTEQKAEGKRKACAAIE